MSWSCGTLPVVKLPKHLPFYCQQDIYLAIVEIVNAHLINSSIWDKRHTRNGSFWEPSRLSDSLRSGSLMTMISCRAGWYLPAWAAISMMCMAWCTETNRNAYFDSGLQLNNVGRPSGSVADYLWPYHTVFVLCFAPTRFEGGSLQNFRRFSHTYTFLCSRIPLKHLKTGWSCIFVVCILYIFAGFPLSTCAMNCIIQMRLSLHLWLCWNRSSSWKHRRGLIHPVRKLKQHEQNQVSLKAVQELYPERKAQQFFHKATTYISFWH